MLLIIPASDLHILPEIKSLLELSVTQLSWKILLKGILKSDRLGVPFLRLNSSEHNGVKGK